MLRTKVFRSGNSQAVRIPREFQFEVEEIEIERRGDEVVLRPAPSGLRASFEALTDLPADFFAEGREDVPPQEREELP